MNCSMWFVYVLHRLSVAFFICLALVGCSESTNFRSPIDRGSQFEDVTESDLTRDLIVGVVWSIGDGNFVEGARLAVEEINAGKDGNQFRYELVVLDENEYLTEVGFERLSQGRYRNASQRLANHLTGALKSNPDLVAVIGHSDKYGTALPAALSYQQSGILFLAAASTDPQLSHLDSPLTFQLSSPDSGLAEQMADYISSRELKNILVLFSRDRKNINFVNFLQKGIERASVPILIHQQAVPDLNLRDGNWSDFDITSIMASLTKAAKEKNIDSVLIVSDMEITLRIIKRTKDFGINVPFIVMPVMSTQAFISDIGEAGVGIVMPTLVDESTSKFKEFSERFVESTKGDRPDSSAALGYDSVYLLDAAMARAKSSKPLNVSLILRYAMPTWAGASGLFGFLENGVNKHRKYIFKRLLRTDSGQLSFVSEGGIKKGG